MLEATAVHWVFVCSVSVQLLKYINLGNILPLGENKLKQ